MNTSAPVKRPSWSLALLALGLAGAPLSSKVAGAVWLGLCLAGAWWALRRGASAPPPLRAAARGWLAACGVALACGAVATAIWRSPWDELHAPLRLALAAAAAVALAGRLHAEAERRWVRRALAAACFGGCGLALYTRGMRDLFPTNAIPWGVSMGFLVCLLVPMLFGDAAVRRRERMALAAGAVAGLLAVLLSLSRGAYGIVPWVALYCGWFLWTRCRQALTLHPRRARLVLASLAAVVLVSVPLMAPVGPRLLETAEQLQAAAAQGSSPSVATANSSIGTRFILWGVALDGFRESPWLGIGREERLRRIAEVGRQLGADQLALLRHVHNSYLQAAFDYGMLGLGMVLALLAGLVWSTRRLGRCDATAGWQMAGLAFMHATADLTNVNMAHNYYGAMLAVMVTLVFALAGTRRV